MIVALIVEDGTGKLDAESYNSVQEFKDYHAKVGNDVSAISDPRIEICLRNATTYMVTSFRGEWKGERRVYNQALDWPRVDAWRDDYDLIPYNQVPKEAKDALNELALLANTNKLLPTSQGRSKKRIEIGPLKIEYDGDGPQSPSFVAAASRLAPLLNVAAGGGMARLVRC